MALKPRSEKYLSSFAVSIAGVIAIATPLFAIQGLEIPKFVAFKDYQQEQKQLRSELTERKITSNKITETGLPIAGSTLTLANYLDNPKDLPKLSKTDLNRYKKTDRVWVFDASDKCIGLILNKRFVSRHHSIGSCDNLPNKIK